MTRTGTLNFTPRLCDREPTTSEYYRAKLAKKLHEQGKSPAEIRAELQKSDRKDKMYRALRERSPEQCHGSR